MCAINGVIGDDTGVLETMLAKTKHRGPDATGIFRDRAVALGHNRLSILDLLERSNQPFISQDGRYVLIFNGEIYNYRHIRKTVKNYKFVTDSDTEVLLALLIQEGDSALNKLQGIFSFAFWDNKHQELLLARDQMGVKPLYYMVANGNLYFSSELTAISEACSVRKLHSGALTSYLYLGYSISENTLISGINKLLPGYKIKYSRDKKLKVSRYWTPNLGDDGYVSSESIQNVISESVTSQLVSDRPIGLTLSGGIDSTIVLHHAHSNLTDIKTFSSYFEPTQYVDDKFNQDAELAKRTAAHYGVPHTTFEITATDVRSSIESILENQSEPVANPTAITRYLLYKKIRAEGIVVVLGGDGGDELFGGYVRYQRVLQAKYFQMLPKFVRDSMSKMSGRARDLNLVSLTDLHLRLVAQSEQNIANLFRVDKFLPKDYLAGIFDERYGMYKSISDPVKRFMIVDRETWLPEESLIQTDVNSMQHSLEARVPLLDTRVVEMADKISTQYKIDFKNTKKILRNSYKAHIPEFIFNQPKRGWQSPGAKWFRDPHIKGYVEEVFSESYYDGLNGLVDWNKAHELFTSHVEGKGYYLYPLWNLLQLQVWARKNNIII